MGQQQRRHQQRKAPRKRKSCLVRAPHITFPPGLLLECSRLADLFWPCSASVVVSLRQTSQFWLPRSFTKFQSLGQREIMNGTRKLASSFTVSDLLRLSAVGSRRIRYRQ